MKRFLAALAVLALFACKTDSDTNINGRFVVMSSYTEPTCTSATGDGDVCVEDDVEVQGNLGVITQTIGIPFHDFRIHDDIDAILDQAAADDDDLTLTQGAFGTVATTLETIDCGGLADTPQYGAFWFTLPPTYVAGSTVSLVVNAGMVATVADQAATIDFSCYVPDYANADATVSSDLITTAAQSVNSLTFADKTFVVDDDVAGHNLAPGSVVQCKLTALCDDDGNAGDNITIRINSIDVTISS